MNDQMDKFVEDLHIHYRRRIKDLEDRIRALRNDLDAKTTPARAGLDFANMTVTDVYQDDRWGDDYLITIKSDLGASALHFKTEDAALTTKHGFINHGFRLVTDSAKHRDIWESS
jgi:hypothetical protein